MIFDHACELGCEGIVSKRLDSKYVSDRSRDWLKAKNPAAPAVKREAEEDWPVIAAIWFALYPISARRRASGSSRRAVTAGTRDWRHVNNDFAYWPKADIGNVRRYVRF